MCSICIYIYIYIYKRTYIYIYTYMYTCICFSPSLSIYVYHIICVCHDSLVLRETAGFIMEVQEETRSTFQSTAMGSKRKTPIPDTTTDIEKDEREYARAMRKTFPYAIEILGSPHLIQFMICSQTDRCRSSRSCYRCWSLVLQLCGSEMLSALQTGQPQQGYVHTVLHIYIYI